MAWGRILNVYAGFAVDGAQPTAEGAQDTFQLVGSDPETGMSGLDCDVEIERSNRMKKNSANIKIYNLNAENRRRLEEPGQVIRIDAGYEKGGHGTIFYGQIDTCETTMSAGGADWCTSITASHFRAKNMAFESLPVSFGYGPGTKLQTVLSDIAEVLGVILLGSDTANIVLERGLIYPGPMLGLLRKVTQILRHNGMDLFYDLGELVVYAVGTPTSEFEAVYLDSDSGLLEARPVINSAKELRQQAQSSRRITKLREKYDSTKTADGKTKITQTIASEQKKLSESEKETSRVRAQFVSLAFHRLRPNAPVQIEHRDVKGIFILDDVTFKLSNYSDNFTAEGWVSREP